MNDVSSAGHRPFNLSAQGTLNDGDIHAAVLEHNANDTHTEREVQEVQRVKFLDHLIRDVDMLVYAQLSALYYMDCSLLQFTLRAVPHWFLFTPKPPTLPPVPLERLPYIGTIFGINAICMLLHQLYAPLAAGEGTRGYLHGGWLIDFVGQASPVTKSRLLGIDLLVLALQIVILGTTLERRAISQKDNDVERVRNAYRERRQDYDSEERGVLRSSPYDIELQDLQRNSGRFSGQNGDDEDTGQDESFLMDEPAQEGQHPLDSYYTGEHVVVNLQVMDLICTQLRPQASATLSNDTSTGSGTEAAVMATAARRAFIRGIGNGERRNQWRQG